MSERPQNLMRSRCPECGTVFRVTSEQLRLKAGKVRCGQCRTVFNAFDQLLVGAGGLNLSPASIRSVLAELEERGLLLTCLWYIREVDPQSLLLTGPVAPLGLRLRPTPAPTDAHPG